MRTERTNKKYTSLDKTWSKNDNTKYKNQMNRAKIQIKKFKKVDCQSSNQGGQKLLEKN